MRINQPRHQRRIAQVNHPRPRRMLHHRSHLFDPIALHQHFPRRHNPPRRHIQHPRRMQHNRRSCRLSSLLPRLLRIRSKTKC